MDDDGFDWPYRDRQFRSVADWWEQTDCRVMRLAVGEDNQYLDIANVPAMPDDTNTTEWTP